jgi:hypothetical protein
MNHFIQHALIANAASLGYHWVYNMPYLKKLQEEKTSLVFHQPDKAVYERARKAYFAYPKAKVGSFSVQGDIARWLYQALKENATLSALDYQNLVYEGIKPGGHYEGYVESYGRQLVLDRLLTMNDNNYEPKAYEDDQLIGFIPYIVTKSLNIETSHAKALTKAFSLLKDFEVWMDALDHLMDKIQFNKELALQQLVKDVPKSYQTSLEKALEMEDTTQFVIQYAGTACHLAHALPLIVHIISKSNGFEDAIEMNTVIGGASSDRGMLIGMIMGSISEVPLKWQKKVDLSLT